MTAARRRGLLTTAWWGGALTTALALIGLLVITGGPGAPRLGLRADTYNQMTGVGSTASAVTVSWTSGLLDSANQPITSTTTSSDGGPELNPNSDRAAGTGPLFFYDSDFKTLQVTVSQTENIGQQGITVSWTGAKASPAVDAPLTDFMQLMECWGDSDSGPGPEDCEYGAGGVLAGTPATREGYLCGSATTPGAVAPSTSNPPIAKQTPGDPSFGCDPYEPAAEPQSHCDQTQGAAVFLTCADGAFDIPFVPANNPGSPVYEQSSLSSEFNQFNTNEVQLATSDKNGNGQRQFETLTANQSPGLGCGAVESGGQTRECWLVIVPRGTFEPNGWEATPTASGLDQDGQFLATSPLSASNWAQRIQVHLDYAPLAANCPPTVLPQAMDGTQVGFRAVNSWEQALNQQSNCATVYSYTATTESASTTALQGADSGGAGLAFTTVPIGSEATRAGGGTAPTLPTILYAPVAVTAIDFGFNVNTNQSGAPTTTPVNLTPALVARGLAQVYQYDLPDYKVAPSEQPAGTTWWAAQNPINITQDPEFQKFNSEITPTSAGHTLAPLLTGDHSEDNQLIWDYVQSDPATAAWLDGGAANSSDLVQADPNEVTQNLGKSPVPDSFPVDYQGKLFCEQVATASQCPKTSTGQPPTQADQTGAPLTSGSLLAFQNNYDQAASNVLQGSDSALSPNWAQFNTAPDGSPGYWSTVGAESPGNTFMWAANDMPDLAAYGLISADLCDAAGANCVQPSVDSVTAALNLATTDSAGLTEVSPATVAAADDSSTPAGAYPLVDVIYAAVPTDQSAAALSAYASFISYATGQGQTEGSNQGDLPAGYLPLTSALQTQAKSVVTQLQALASGSASPSASPSTSATGTSTSGSTTTGGTSTSGSTTTGGTSTSGSTTTGGTSTSGSTTTGGTSTSGSTTTGGTSTSGSTTTGGTSTSGSTASTSAHGTQSTAASPTSSPTTNFDVLLPTAEAAAGTTPPTTVGSIRVVLIIVLIIGAAGGLAGGWLRYGHLPGRGRRSRYRADSS